MSRKRLSIELPWCPVCDHVGAIPASNVVKTKVTSYCVGPSGAPHKKQRMERRRFVESREKAAV